MTADPIGVATSVSKDDHDDDDAPMFATDARRANLRWSDNVATSCAMCAYYMAHRGCQVVAGATIRPDMTCDLYAEAEAIPVLKYDDDRQIVFGWANVSVRKSGEQVVDSHNEMIDPAELEQAAYEFVLHYRETGEMHDGKVAKGQLIESMVYTPEKLETLGLAPDALPQGWWVGFHISDPEVFAKVKDGTYAMFSIEGQAVPQEVT